MPNHVTNRLKATEGDFSAILEAVKGKEEVIDFNKIIPMPESMNISASNITEMVMGLIPDYVKSAKQVDSPLREKVRNAHPCLNDEERLDKTIAEAITAKENKRLYGYANWYDWRYANWDTKWNAYESYVDGEEIVFQTAWSTPENVIKVLSEMLPAAEIEVAYADEDWGHNCGVYRYKNGKKTYENIPAGGSEEAKRIATEVTGYDWSDCEEEDE